MYVQEFNTWMNIVLLKDTNNNITWGVEKGNKKSKFQREKGRKDRE